MEATMTHQESCMSAVSPIINADIDADIDAALDDDQCCCIGTA